jgi:lipopolysaccharide transport system permease protein
LGNERGHSQVVIEAGHTQAQYWRDLWRYRGLLYFLARRDVVVRYKQAVIGAAWAVLRPLLTMAVLTLVFSYVARIPSSGVPYPILVLAGLLPWQLFQGSLAATSSSLVANAPLISKVYFPRLLVPMSVVVAALADLAISLVLLGILMLGYGFHPGPEILCFPIFLGLALLAAFGSGLWFGALAVRYRDVTQIVPVLLQVGLYVSPVGYSSQAVPEAFRFIYSLNPMVGVIEGFRWTLLGGHIAPEWRVMVPASTLIGTLTLTGIWYFRKTESRFADYI